MAVNRGKQFEYIMREEFARVPNTSVIRLHDQTTGFAGSTNICDLVVYHYPTMYCIECKSIHGNTFPLSNLTDNQLKGLREQSLVDGVVSGVMCWWVDREVTKFIPIQVIDYLIASGRKSIRYDDTVSNAPLTHKTFDLTGKKKRVFFEYNMQEFFDMEGGKYDRH